jgi:hypothetical protein
MAYQASKTLRNPSTPHYSVGCLVDADSFSSYSDVTNKYLQAPSETKRVAQGQIGGRNLACRVVVVKQDHPHSIILHSIILPRKATDSTASRLGVFLTSSGSWGAQLDPDWDPDFSAGSVRTG